MAPRPGGWWIPWLPSVVTAPTTSGLCKQGATGLSDGISDLHAWMHTWTHSQKRPDGAARRSPRGAGEVMRLRSAQTIMTAKPSSGEVADRKHSIACAQKYVFQRQNNNIKKYKKKIKKNSAYWWECICNMPVDLQQRFYRGKYFTPI